MTVVKMRFCYADPPYIGCAHLYSDDPNAAEVDHNKLMRELMDFGGWALSCSSTSLKIILSMPSCPEDVRIGAWVKPWASFKPGVNPAYAWEPVIFWGGRARGREVRTLRDWISVNATMQKGLVGAKPVKFCYWIFEMLGARPDDTFIDLYPGTGIVSRAWEAWYNNTAAQLDALPLFE